MFVELGLFTTEKDQYEAKIKEINDATNNDEEKKRKLDAENEKFKGQVRKFLPSALNIIKSTFGCDYSIYKVGKDFNSEFKVVETNVRKTKSEVIAEMNEFKLKAESMNLSQDVINKINLAMDVFLTYSEDAVDTIDENKEDYMKYAKVTTSSIVSVPTRSNNAFEPITNEIQHNPYSNQALPGSDINHNPYTNSPPSAPGFKDDSYEAKPTLVDPFAAIYNGTAISQETSPLPNNVSNNINQANQVNPIFLGQQQERTLTNEPINNNQFIQPQNVNIGATNQPQQDIQFSFGGVNSNMDYGDSNKFIQNNNPNEVITQNITANNKDWNISGDREEHPTLITRILSGILIPILSIIITVILMKSIELEFVANLLLKMTEILKPELYLVFICLIIGIICFILGSIVIIIAKRKTNYIGKFLILPSLITSALIFFFPNILDFANSLFEFDFATLFIISIYSVVSIYIAEVFISLLFLRLIFRKRNKLSRIKWNIMEKTGFLVLIYTVFIPTIILVLGLLNIPVSSSIIEFVGKMYDYKYAQYVMGGLSILLALLVIIFNIREDKRL